MNELAAMKDFFDRLAPEWENNPEEYDIRERLVDRMGLAQNSLIADIGCGKGVMIEHLLKTRPRRIIAIDLSGEMIKYAKERCADARVTFINGDALMESLPMLDAALIFNAYPHFTDKAALADKLAETVRPGGCVVIAHSAGKETINGIHKGDRVTRLSTPLRRAAEEAREFEAHFSAETLIDTDDVYFIKMIRKG